MIDLFSVDSAAAEAVVLNNPPPSRITPATGPTTETWKEIPGPNELQPVPSGNTPLFIAAAIAMHQHADATVDPKQTVATLKTIRDARACFARAAAAVDASQNGDETKPPSVAREATRG